MMALKISVKLAGGGGMQSPGGNWFITNNRNCSISTPFFISLSHTLVWKAANLAVMAARFSFVKMVPSSWSVEVAAEQLIKYSCDS